MPRFCNDPSCGKILVQRDRESLKEFIKRIYCIDRCKDHHKKAVNARSLRAQREAAKSHEVSVSLNQCYESGSSSL